MEKLFTIRETASLLSVSIDTLKRLQRHDRLHVLRLGRSVRITKDEIDRVCREEFRK